MPKLSKHKVACDGECSYTILSQPYIAIKIGVGCSNMIQGSQIVSRIVYE
jgi:hypothetical protein